MKLRSYVFAVVVCFLSSVTGMSAAVAPAPAQGAIGGAQIAVLQSLEGDVRVARAATPNNVARVTTAGLALATGDAVRTLQGKAEIRFNDNSIVSLNFGTVVVIAEQPTAGGVQRTIQQFLGSLWFNIERVTGTNTTLQTPTAVAAIRGTQGTQDVPNLDQSTHALNEGEELITEGITQQSVTLRAGQSVTAIRGIGFTPIAALVAVLARPVFAGGGGGGGVAGGGGGGVGGAGGGAGGGAAGGAGGGAAGGAGGGAAGAATGAATGAAAATTATATTAVSSLAATITSVGVSAATSVVTNVAVPFAAQNNDPQQQAGNAPLNPPGGAITVIDDGKQASAFMQSGSTAVTETAFTAPVAQSYASLLRPKPRLMSRFGGTIPMTAASGSLWAIGALTHNERLARTGQQATRAVFAAEALSGALKLGATLRANRSDARSFVSSEAMRTFAFATVMRREYRDKPLIVIGSYGLATAVSLSGIGGQRQTPSQVLFGAVVGELIGRFVTRRNNGENR